MIIHTARTQQKNKRKKKKRNIIHRIPQIEKTLAGIIITKKILINSSFFY